MININTLKFDKDGLIPAITIDEDTGEVLTLAYMNKESLQISIDEGRTCYWSRSRSKLWRKGENSGNIQHILDIKADCDMDALLITVRKEGPACHTGAESCFINSLDYNPPDKPGQASGSAKQDKTGTFSLENLHKTILDRRTNAKPGSYTNYLFDKGIDKILKKFGEESTEVIIAAKGGNTDETVYELADLVYHAYVLMTELGIDPARVVAELAARAASDGDN